MSDTVSTLASKLRPFWLRDVGISNGGSAGGAGGGMVAHALNGPYHTGEIDPSQASWAVTQDDLDAIDTHPRLHDLFSLLDHTATGAAGQIIGLTATDTLGRMTPANGLGLSGTNLILLSSVAGAGLTYTDGVLAVGAGAGLTVNANDVALTTPGSLGQGTAEFGTNDATGSHTHKFFASPDPGQNSRPLATDANGVLTLYRLRAGDAFTLYSTNNIGTGPDVQFATNGLLAAETSIYLNADSTNTGSGAIIFSRGAATSAATESARFTNAGRLGIGLNNPGYELDVVGTARASVALRTADVVASTNVRTPSIDTGSGSLTISPANATVMIAGANSKIITDTGQPLYIQPTEDLLLNPGSNLVKLQSGKMLQSHNYASQTTGMRITGAGEGDFRYIYTDELHAKAFIADLEQALAGGQIITKSVTILASNFTAPAAGGTATLHVKDLPSATGMQVFQSGDIIRLRQFSRAGGSLSITNCWGVVTGYVDVLDGTQTWTFTRSTGGNAGAMAAGAVVEKDAIVLDYGTTGNGFYEVNAIDGMYALNSPYAQIVNWTTHPATGQTVRSRLGNLRGIFGAADEYGLFAGSGTANTDQYFRASSTAFRINNIPLQMYNAGTQTFYLASDGSEMWIGPSSSNKQLNYSAGNLTITGTVTATAGEIANWDIGVIDANTLSSSNIRLISGTSGTARIEVGASGDDYAGIISRSLTSGVVFWAGKAYGSESSAPYRVTLGGTLNATDAYIAGEVTATSGYIGSAANGWTISSDRITANGIRVVSARADGNNTSRIELGDYDGAGAGQLAVIGLRGVPSGTVATSTVAQWAGRNYSNRGTAPFRLTFGGDLIATSATITGAITADTGYIGGASGWVIASGLLSSSNVRLYSGSTTDARLELGSGSGANTAGVRGGNATAAAVAFWAGATHANRETAPFRAYLDGRLYATDATIEGDIIAETGYIGGASGWTIATGKLSSGNIDMWSGAVGTARIDLGLAGITGSPTAGQVNIWAGTTHDNRAAAPFRVYDNGNAIINALTIAGDSNVTGSLFAGRFGGVDNIRFSTDGQRMKLSTDTSPNISTSSSAIRWLPSLTASWDSTISYTGMIGYKNTSVNPDVLDMTITSCVGDSEDDDFDARVILQAGHYASGVYSDTLLVITREKGAGAKTINAICDTFNASNNVYVTGNMSAASVTDRTPHYEGDALADIRKIKGGKKGIDHASMPDFARRQVRTMDGKTEEGRDLGAMISILVAAVGQLEGRIAAMEERQ